MPRITVRFDIRAFQRTLNDLQKKQVPKAAKIALGRVATTVRKVVSQRIRERLNIKSAAAKAAITIRRNARVLVISIEAKGKPIPIRDYGAKATKRGVTFKVVRGGERKLYSNKYGPGFIVAKAGGHVFARVEPEPRGIRRALGKRARIRKVYGPSVPQYFVTQLITQVMVRTARERWPLEFAAAWRGLGIRQSRRSGRSR